MTYERVFIKIRRTTSDDTVYKFAKKQSIFRFFFRPRELERWSNTTFHNRLASKAAVKKSIADFKAMVAYERNPKEVPPDEGWSPYEAKDFLSEHGLKTGYYNNVGDDEWFASSNYLDLEEGIFPNRVAYYVSGDQVAAKSLKLRLYVNEPKKGDEAITRFVSIAETLLAATFSASVSTNLEELFREGQDAETKIAGKLISISKEDWHQGKTGQFEITLVITVLSPDRTSP